MRSIMSLFVGKLIDARRYSRPCRLSPDRVIIIEFVNLVLDTTDRIRRVGGKSREEGEKKKRMDTHRKFLTDERVGRRENL